MNREDNNIPQPAIRISKFEKLGYGLFIHWGLYSQLGQGEWIQNFKKIPKEEDMPPEEIEKTN